MAFPTVILLFQENQPGNFWLHVRQTYGQNIVYVLQNLDKNNAELSQVDVKLSEIMATYWTNFAKFGDPNSKDLVGWPQFNETSETVMYFQQQPKVGQVPDKKAVEVLDE